MFKIDNTALFICRPSRPRPVSDTQAPQLVNLVNMLPSTLPRKLEPLDRKPDVPDVR